jgi:uncharacterized protein (DUF302 family)
MANISGDHGIITVPSPYTANESLDRIEASARSKGMLIFLRLDQRREAEKVGLTLRPTELLLFGNPKAGTVLMNASETVAIDLPLKALAWEDAHGKVWVSYDSPDYLRERHQLSEDLVKLIAGIGNLIGEAIR